MPSTTGKVAEKALEAAGITVNKKTISYDNANPPPAASGLARRDSRSATWRYEGAGDGPGR